MDNHVAIFVKNDCRLRFESVANLDNIHAIPKNSLREQIGSIPLVRHREVKRALGYVLDWPELKVLFTTGYTRNAIVHHGRLDADVVLIGKPYSPSDLGAKIRSLLDRSV